MSRSEWWHESEPVHSFLRGLEFWKRASGIYLSYKLTQLRVGMSRLRGRDDDWINTQIWKPHNEATGQRMYDLCVDLRGFYLKANHNSIILLELQFRGVNS